MNQGLVMTLSRKHHRDQPRCLAGVLRRPGRTQTVGRPFVAGLMVLLALAGCGTNENSSSQPTTLPTTNREVVRSAEQGPVKITVKLDRQEAVIPEPVKLSIMLESEQGVEVDLPDLGAVIGPFGIAGHQDRDPTSDGWLLRREREYTLEPFMPGETSLPPIVAKYLDHREKGDGSRNAVEGKVATPPIKVVVRAGLADVKGPLSIPRPGWQRLLLWLLAVVAGLVAIALGARWWQRRRGAYEARQPEAARVPAHEWALTELDRLQAENLPIAGRVQEYYYRVNWIVRRYIELRFALKAGEQTSEEFIRSLREAALLDEGHKEVLRRFVAACDPVKYARHQPEQSEISWVQITAKDFVLETAERRESNG